MLRPALEVIVELAPTTNPFVVVSPRKAPLPAVDIVTPIGVATGLAPMVAAAAVNTLMPPLRA